MLYKEFIGTPYFMAPEVIKLCYDEKCDLWSIGILLYVILCGLPPFDGKDNKEIMNNVKLGKFKMSSEIWDNVSDDAKDLISKLLVLSTK